MILCKSLTQDRPTGLCIMLGTSDKLAIKLKLMINLLEGMHFFWSQVTYQKCGDFWNPNWICIIWEAVKIYTEKRRQRLYIPGSKLILTSPGEFPEALVALVVVVEHPVQCGSTQVHQSVVCCLLLLSAGVAVEEVIDLISYFWKDKNNFNEHWLSAASSAKYQLRLPEHMTQFQILKTQ